MFGKSIRTDCVFKKNIENDCIKCTYPKSFKNCYLCTTYLQNDGELDDKLKYIEHVNKIKSNNTALFFSISAFLIAIINLLIKLFETIKPK
jgi:hypothetical protein